MLSAMNEDGEVVATEITRYDGPFYCPVCREQVMLKQGLKVVAHFAHYSDSTCTYAGERESVQHQQAKLDIYQALLQASGVSEVRLERPLQDARPDVSFALEKQLVAIEVQVSQLSRDDIARRTIAYARQDIAVLWTPLFSGDFFSRRYAPKDWERYLHRMYFGKVYYWLKGLKVVPVRFDEYQLEPNWYAGVRRSKRYVTPTLLPDRSLLDLAPVWRSQWGDVPRAKLWCEPWQQRRHDNQVDHV